MNQQNRKTPIPFDTYLKEFPSEIQGLIRQGWQSLSPERQAALRQVSDYLPTDRVESMRKLVGLGKVHVDMALGNRQSIAIVGPANVGKSTLFNRLIADGEKPALVSAVPGTTKTNQQGDASLFDIVDTPGVDAVGNEGLQERRTALMAADEADLLLIVFDAVQGIKAGEKRFLEELKQLDKPFLITLNKIDMTPRWEREEVITKSAQLLKVELEKIIPISAKTGENLGEVVAAIVKTEPALMAALGKALPHYRSNLAWRSILRAASTAASVALTPLPIIDFIPLVTIQALLVVSIARIYAYKITLARARELLGVMGMGYLGRLVFYEITKLGGPPTWIVSVGVAAATTVVVGYSAILWFEKGERLTEEGARRAVRLVSERIIQRLRERWQSRGKRKPNRQGLEQELSTILDEGLDQLTDLDTKIE